MTTTRRRRPPALVRRAHPTQRGWVLASLDTPPDQRTAGQRFMLRRLSQGWTQSQVAALAGVSRQTVSHLERDRLRARPDVARRLLALLMVRVDVPDPPPRPSRPARARVIPRAVAPWDCDPHPDCTDDD